jgi:hypothetical protein
MDDATDRLVEVFREFDADALRDVWLFDQWNHERLYVRGDVAAALEDLSAGSVDGLVDNERYGYVTRDAYERLYYADYEYTVRGFDSFDQFRTFLGDDAEVGVLAGFDADGRSRDYRDLHGRLAAFLADRRVAELLPDSA